MSYYSEKLSGNRLKQCYAIAPARIVQYLDAEIDYILSLIQPTDSILELGCGYGRVTKKLAEIANNVTGIDTANASLQLAKADDGLESKIAYLKMDATQMEFRDMTFDVVFCVQNGICAFGVDKSVLIQEALRVTQPGGKVIFSSYSNNIWADRLKWFELQSAHGLLGEIEKWTPKLGHFFSLLRCSVNPAVLFIKQPNLLTTYYSNIPVPVFAYQEIDAFFHGCRI